MSYQSVFDDTQALAEDPPRGSLLAVSIEGVSRVLFCATATVAGLGIVREVIIARIGEHTAVKDLRHIALNSEHCLGAWYQSTLMLVAAAILGVIAHLSKRHGHRFVWHWRLLALVFAYLAADELLAIHELVNAPLEAALHTEGVLYFAWVIPAAVLVGLFALAYLPFLVRLPKSTAIGMIAAGAIFVGGALGLEVVGGWLLSRSGGEETFAYMVAYLAEEVLEMIGVCVFIMVLLRHFVATWPDARAEMD